MTTEQLDDLRPLIAEATAREAARDQAQLNGNSQDLNVVQAPDTTHNTQVDTQLTPHTQPSQPDQEPDTAVRNMTRTQRMALRASDLLHKAADAAWDYSQKEPIQADEQKISKIEQGKQIAKKVGNAVVRATKSSANTVSNPATLPIIHHDVAPTGGDGQLASKWSSNSMINSLPRPERTKKARAAHANTQLDDPESIDTAKPADTNSSESEPRPALEPIPDTEPTATSGADNNIALTGGDGQLENNWDSSNMVASPPLQKRSKKARSARADTDTEPDATQNEDTALLAEDESITADPPTQAETDEPDSTSVLSATPDVEQATVDTTAVAAEADSLKSAETARKDVIRHKATDASTKKEVLIAFLKDRSDRLVESAPDYAAKTARFGEVVLRVAKKVAVGAGDEIKITKQRHLAEKLAESDVEDTEHGSKKARAAKVGKLIVGDVIAFSRSMAERTEAATRAAKADETIKAHAEVVKSLVTAKLAAIKR